MPLPSLHLEVRSAYPSLSLIASLPINPRVTAVSITADDKSGWNRCQIGYTVQVSNDRTIAAYLPEPVAVEDGAVVRLTSGADVLFLGVVTDSNEGSIVAEGLGLWAPRWAWITPGGAERVSMGTIVGEGFETCPWLRLTELVDTGVARAWSELTNRSLGDAINQMLTEGGIPPGDTVAAGWMFLVFDDPSSDLGQARIVPKLPATEPHYTYSYDRDTMNVTWKRDIVDAVRVAYTEGGVSRVTEWVYRSGVDQSSRWLRRETLSGQASTDGAIQVALTFLAQHSAPQLSGTISLHDWRGLNHRPGETISMLGMGPATGEKVLISQTSSDLFSGVTTLNLGEPTSRTWQGYTRLIDRTITSVKRGRDYTTGSVAT